MKEGVKEGVKGTGHGLMLDGYWKARMHVGILLMVHLHPTLNQAHKHPPALPPSQRHTQNTLNSNAHPRTTHILLTHTV